MAGFGSAFGSGQEHDVVRTVDLENSAVALCNISESNNGQEKKEINNESYHFYKAFRERSQETERDYMKEELLKIEIKLTQMISEMNDEASNELEKEFQMLIHKRNQLRNQVNN